MKVHELIEILGDYEPDLEVEMAVVCPVDQPDDRVAVDRYPIEVVLPYSDDDDPSDVLWLVGGEEADVDAFEEAMGLDDDGAEDGEGDAGA